jgi:hypothetical protein
MAGREAEEELLGHCRGGDDDDQHQIQLMLEEIYRSREIYRSEEELEKVEQRLRRFARFLVCRHRPKIEALARELIEKRTMSDKRVRLAAGLPPRLRRLSEKEAYRRWCRRNGIDPKTAESGADVEL